MFDAFVKLLMLRGVAKTRLGITFLAILKEDR
jgi:hypothetical protein